MTSHRPPAVATWLLARVCADDALCGDLVEEYRARDSKLWYWRQALVAVSVYPFSQIVAHKWLAARAIATGLVIWYIFNATLLKGIVRPWIDMDATGVRAFYFGLMYALWLGNGWIIAKLHRPYAAAMVLAFVLWSLIASVPPIYTVVMQTLEGSSGGSELAWTVFARVATLVTLMSGGVLAVSRSPGRKAQAAAHRAIAAR